MGVVNEGSLQVIDLEVILENRSIINSTGITIRYILTSSIAMIVVFVFHTISYICDSMMSKKR